jgi:predicted PurR-regulated permease PerM
MTGGRADELRLIRNSLLGLLILALLYTAFVAADLLIPIVIAVFLSVLLFPLIRLGEQVGLPSAIVAGGSVLGVLAMVGLTAATLSEPAQEWLEHAPESLRELRKSSGSALFDFTQIREVAEEVESLADMEGTSDTPESPEVVVKEPDVLQTVLFGLPELMGKTAIIVFLTFFFVLTGKNWLLKATRCGHTWGQRRRIVVIGRNIQKDITVYLGTVTIINVSLGASTALFLWLIGVPDPLMWGLLVAAFNFAPYAGALVSAGLLTIVGLTHFDTLTMALLVPGGFMVLTILEGQIITPAILGARMSISPAIVLLAVIFGAWLWGIAGALLAVPILVSFKALCDHYPPMHFVAYFLTNDKRLKHQGSG